MQGIVPNIGLLALGALAMQFDYIVAHLYVMLCCGFVQDGMYARGINFFNIAAIIADGHDMSMRMMRVEAGHKSVTAFQLDDRAKGLKKIQGAVKAHRRNFFWTLGVQLIKQIIGANRFCGLGQCGQHLTAQGRHALAALLRLLFGMRQKFGKAMAAMAG